MKRKNLKIGLFALGIAYAIVAGAQECPIRDQNPVPGVPVTILFQNSTSNIYRWTSTWVLWPDTLIAAPANFILANSIRTPPSRYCYYIHTPNPGYQEILPVVQYTATNSNSSFTIFPYAILDGTYGSLLYLSAQDDLTQSDASITVTGSVNGTTITYSIDQK